jgi:hypothetical protein
VIMPDTLAIAFVSSLHTTLAATTFDRLWRRSLATCQNGVMKYEEKKIAKFGCNYLGSQVHQGNSETSFRIPRQYCIIQRLSLPFVQSDNCICRTNVGV